MSLIKTISFKEIGDERGSLVSLEENSNIPFVIKRVYYIFGTKSDVVRGMHAHKDLEQVAVCVKGSCTFTLDNGVMRETVVLDNESKGLLIGNNIWREMSNFSSDCVLLVLASQFYDESDYIREYADFLEIVNDVR